MTIKELATQAVEHVKKANGKLSAGDVADAYLSSLEELGANHGVCEMFYQLMNKELKDNGLKPMF